MSSPAHPAGTMHTFPIRFGRLTGFAAIFYAAENSFGWRGDGSLSIDAAGAEVAVGRSIASLLARRRSQRIPAEDIREVYREGEALRVEFVLGADRRAVLPFRARDRDTAAQIVQLLPTLRTVEIEDAPADSQRKAPQLAPWSLITLATIVIGASLLFVIERPAATPSAAGSTASSPPSPPVAAVVTTHEGGSPSVATAAAPTAGAATRVELPDSTPADTAAIPVESASLPEKADSAPPQQPAQPAAKAAPKPARAEEPEVEGFVPAVPPIYMRPEEVVVPIRQNTLAFDAARSILSRFESGANELSEYYRQKRAQSDAGRLNLDDFASALDSLANRWDELATRLLNTAQARDPALTGFTASLLAVTTYERSFLTDYAAAVRARNADAAASALEELAHADEMLERARLYVR